MTDIAPSPALSRVTRGALCAGCGGCAVAAPGKIAMQPDTQGYLRPVQTATLTPAEETRIAATCPGLGVEITAGTRTDHTIWGPYETMLSGWATDPEVRRQGSSGGALTALLLYLLRSGRIDGVIQTHASLTDPVGNATSLSRTEAEILASTGSRYAPSAPLAPLTEHLDTPGRLAFVGKPCDAAALRALARHDPRIDDRIAVVLSFFCGGIPSLEGANRIVAELGVAREDLAAFRYRGNGWPGKTTATLKDGTTRQMTYAESWGNILSHHLQHRCKICADGSGKTADIVCADAWTADERGYPVFEEGEGVSLIVARTALGSDIVDAAMRAGRIEAAPFDPEALAAIQPGQFWRRRVVLARLVALRLMGRPVPRYRGLHLAAMARKSTLKELGTNFLGMVRRVLTRRV